jgi:hypothetical protein
MNHVPDFDEYRAAKAAKTKRSPRPPRAPSQIQDKYWVSANSRTNRVRFTERSGKWLIFVPMAELDDAWSKIKQATQAGLLSNDSKGGDRAAQSECDRPDPEGNLRLHLRLGRSRGRLPGSPGST